MASYKETPALEKLSFDSNLNKQLLSYISEFGKMYTSLLKSSKWSEPVKKENLNNFQKIEKKFKSSFNDSAIKKRQCDKSNCECKDCVPVKGKRWNAKKFLITFPKTSIDKTTVLKYFVNNFDTKEVAVAQEHHEDGSLHIHCYLEFVAKKNIKSPKYFYLPNKYTVYGNTVANIQTIGKKTKESVFNYLLKEDKQCLSYGFNIHVEKHGKLKRKDIYRKLLEGTWSLKDLVLYDPCFIFENKIENFVNKYIENETFIKKHGNMTFDLYKTLQ